MEAIGARSGAKGIAAKTAAVIVNIGIGTKDSTHIVPQGGPVEISRLRCDLHVFPKRNASLDALRGSLGSWVIPGGINIALAADFDRVVACRSFPRADRMRPALMEELPFERGSRKVVVSFNDDRIVALRHSASMTLFQIAFMVSKALYHSEAVSRRSLFQGIEDHPIRVCFKGISRFFL